MELRLDSIQELWGETIVPDRLTFARTPVIPGTTERQKKREIDKYRKLNIRAAAWSGRNGRRVSLSPRPHHSQTMARAFIPLAVRDTKFSLDARRRRSRPAISPDLLLRSMRDAIMKFKFS